MFVLASCVGSFLSGNVCANNFCRATSRTLFSFADTFCSKICFGYNQRSLIKPPKIPRHFAGPRKGQKALERDLDFLLDSHCKISLHLYQMSLLSMGGPVSAGDIEQREQLRDRLDAWSAELPSLDCYLVRCHRYYHYLRYASPSQLPCKIQLTQASQVTLLRCDDPAHTPPPIIKTNSTAIFR